ncbi:MAG: polyprenol monophosphomannose synthase [Planctomycetaceae bacterium]|nr:polyprenol monophosphomannose synthase [Planctomycetaceae bacterium]
MSADEAVRLLITVCTFNEVDNIRLLIPELRSVAPDADVLVIDDNSPDGTGEVVREFASADSRVHLLHRPKKLGLGAATLAGFRYGIEHQYDRLINLDADFSHNPRHIPELLALSREVDVAIGSRYVPGGGVVGWNLKRHFMSQSINLYARLFLGLKTRDNSGSYRCYSVPRLAEIDWDRTLARGYAFQEEVLYRCRRIGCTFGESPIVFEDRRFGVTKISWREAVAALWIIFRLGLHRMFRGRVRL